MCVPTVCVCVGICVSQSFFPSRNHAATHSLEQGSEEDRVDKGVDKSVIIR